MDAFKTNPSKRNIRAMGGAGHSVFPRRRHSVAARLAEMVMTRVFAFLAALAAVSLPRPPRLAQRPGGSPRSSRCARFDAWDRVPPTCVRTTLQFRRAARLTSPHDAPLSSQAKRTPTEPDQVEWLVSGTKVRFPRSFSRARGTTPALGWRETREISPPNTKISFASRASSVFLPSRRHTPSADDAPAPIAALLPPRWRCSSRPRAASCIAAATTARASRTRRPTCWAKATTRCSSS